MSRSRQPNTVDAMSRTVVPEGDDEAGAEVGFDGVRFGAAQVVDVFDVQAERDEEVERHEDESDEPCRRGDTEPRCKGGHHRRDEQHPVRLVQAVDDDVTTPTQFSSIDAAYRITTVTIAAITGVFGAYRSDWYAPIGFSGTGRPEEIEVGSTSPTA
jgi:hypothetical protein